MPKDIIIQCTMDIATPTHTDYCADTGTLILYSFKVANIE